MAVALALTYSQSNDAKTLLFTDSTGAYDAVTNTGGWGAPNQVTSDIVLSSSTTVDKYWLTLDITYTNSADESTVYDTIYLYDELDFVSEFSKSYGMEFELNMTHLLESGVAAGTVTDVFPDGIYDVTYTITEADTDLLVYAKDYELLIYGNIQIAVFDMIRENVSTVYKQKLFNADERDWQELLEAEFIHAYYNGLIASADDAQRSKKIEMLYFLEQKLNN